MRIVSPRLAHRFSLPLSTLFASLLLTAGLASAQVIAPVGPVAFPAAAGIRPTDQPVGPVRIEPEPSALSQFVHPEDAVIFDFDGTAIDTINSQGATAGALTTVASPSVGSGTAFTQKVSFGTVSPTQQLYYWNSNTALFYRVDLTSANFPRAQVIQPSSATVYPWSVQRGFPGIAWDFANNAFIYYDGGTGGVTQSNGSTIIKGIYRFTPSTTVGVPSTNTLLFNLAAAGFGTTTGCNGIAVKQDGTIYALLDITNQTTPQIIRIDSLTTYTRVDGTAGTYTGFQTLTGLSWDFTNQRILVFDQAQSQAAAKIISLDPTNGTRTLVSSGNSSSGAYGGGYINAPTSGFRNTANRILYTDIDVPTFTKLELSTVPPGSTVASQYYTAGTFGLNAQFMTFVPPTLPVIASPTATASGTAETIGASVTSPGTAIVAPAVQTRGVVYSLTSANSNPTIGGTGVTQLAASAATGTFTVSTGALATGANYSYAGYVSTYYGLVYTPVSSFVTATIPTVTSPTATAITGVSATLGGNVTSDGGATLNARGVVYSVTTTNATPVIGGASVTNLPDASAITGVFTDGTGNVLANGTGYSYRAYASNSVGTSYSATGTFTTAAKPTANAQSVTTAFNTAKAITLTGTDPNTPTQTLTYAVSVNPTHGTLSGTAPNLTYTPTAGYQGADSFQFTVTNTAGLTSTAATVSITVTPGTPTANAQSVSVTFNTAKAITLTGTDPDSPALSLTYAIATNPTHGTLSGFNASTGAVTYTPNTNYTGADSFTFTVSNGTNTSAAATVSLTVVGQPTITGFSPTSGPVGTTVTITGGNLQNATGVNFLRNLPGTSFTIVTATQVTVQVPAGAATGTLTVLSGSGSNSSTTKFTVTP